MDIKEFQITYEDIVKFHDARIKAAERELETLKNTREFSMDKLGRMVSLESDIKYHTMVKEACEKQVKKLAIWEGPYNDAKDDAEAYCPNNECNYELNADDWSFCPMCGTSVVFHQDEVQK